VPTILDIPSLIAASDTAQRLFQATLHLGAAIIPPPMAGWAQERFGDLEAVQRQQIVRVCNRYTLEEALYNPLRARRPLDRQAGDLEALIATRLADEDIFAAPLTHTTEDSFGRIRGRYCVSASNVAKYDGWHGVVIFDEPHPLRFEPEQLRDYLDVALRWLHAAHARDASACYPLIIWNCLPRSGASIVHGHLQMSLAQGQHYSRVEIWRRAARAYAKELGHEGCAGYFADLLQAHADLGLAWDVGGDARAAASLTPVRNREVLISSPAADERLADALHLALRGLIERQGVRAFNVAVYLPPFAATPEDWRGFPTLARIVDRGDPLGSSSDFGAIELFASSVISASPFDVAEALR
jgi:hypothetical protein